MRISNSELEWRSRNDSSYCGQVRIPPRTSCRMEFDADSDKLPSFLPGLFSSVWPAFTSAILSLFVCLTQNEVPHAFGIFQLRGLPCMTSAIFSDFLSPLPLCPNFMDCLSANWLFLDPPSPLWADVIYGSPLIWMTIHGFVSIIIMLFLTYCLACNLYLRQHYLPSSNPAATYVQSVFVLWLAACGMSTPVVSSSAISLFLSFLGLQMKLPWGFEIRHG